jgi:hypothetical protein
VQAVVAAPCPVVGGLVVVEGVWPAVAAAGPAEWAGAAAAGMWRWPTGPVPGAAGLGKKRLRDWLLGHFVGEADDPRATTAVEVKWGVHPAGEGRDGWATDEQRTTLLILVRGRFRLDLSVGSTTLEKEGDYAVWGPGIDHSWQAEEDSIVITVRWPSIPSS